MCRLYARLDNFTVHNTSRQQNSKSTLKMASGVAVNPRCVEVFNEIKLGHKHRYVIYALTPNLKEIDVLTIGEKSENYENFVGHLKEAEEKNECRYGVFDAEYHLSDGQERSKLVFFLWSPETAKIKQKMIYTSSKDYIKKALVGIAKEVQANDHGDLEWQNILEVCMRNEAGGN